MRGQPVTPLRNSQAPASTQAAPAAAQTAVENKAAVAAKFEAWKAGTGNPFELLADGASWTIEGNSAASKTYPTKGEFIREVIQPFNARMSVGIKPMVKSITAEGDRVVVHFDALLPTEL